MKRKRIFLLIGVMVVCANVYFSCGDSSTPDETTPIVTTTATDGYATYDGGQPIVILDNGRTLNGEDEIMGAFREIYQNDPNAEINLEISGEEAPAEATAEEGIQPNAVIKLPYDYYVVVHTDRHYIGSCIGREVSHINFAITKKNFSGSIANLHVASWFQSGRVCVAVYATAKNKPAFCKKICSPTPRDIIGAIAAALIAMGVAASVAWAIAYIIGPIACGALLI